MTKPLTSLVLSTLLLSTTASVELVGEHFTAELDIPYGKGLVTVDGNITQRDLLMDVVIPAEPKAEQNPVVVMTFGGNFIRGGRNDVYSVEGAQTTTMRDYCKLFAKEGYTCVAIDYRLSLEEPVPSNIGYTDELLVEDELRMKALHDRHNMLRQGKGLEPLPDGSPIVRNTIISAAEDLYRAVEYLQGNADKYSIDPERIAVGGFSAGAMTSFNVAYGMNAPVKAVLANSGRSLGFDVEAAAKERDTTPPALLQMGQYDLEPLVNSVRYVLPGYEELGIDVDLAWVPGFGHFYPAGAMTLGTDLARSPIIERMVAFLDTHL